jgi:hypothetical protein
MPLAMSFDQYGIGPTLNRVSLRVGVVSRDVHIVDAISATCAIVFVAYLPFRLRKLRKAHIKAFWDWQGLFKFVSVMPR